MRVFLQVVVRPKEDGRGYLAICPTLQGCHAEGDTPGVALDNVQDVAKTLLELRHEDGLPLPTSPSEDSQNLVEGRLAVNIG